MKKIFAFFIALIMFIIPSCVDSNAIETNYSASKELEDKINPYILQFEQNVSLNTLENEDGILLGAKIDTSEDYGINEFEEKLVKSPNHYVYEYILGTTFDTDIILECIAKNKILFLKIIPNKYTVFSLNEISSVTNIINMFNVDCYIELLPNPTLAEYTPENYKGYFEQSSKILKSGDNKVAIIFTPSVEEISETSNYCPNLDSFDFVGYNYIGYIKNKNQYLYEDFFSKLNYVYKAYSDTKPIFITTFALSYYSGKYDTYYTNENIMQINIIFDTIEKNYERVKAVNFYDVDIKQSPFKYAKYNDDNYRITENEKILANFNNLISKKLFKNKIENDGQVDDTIQFIYDAVMVNNEYYVSEKILTNKFLMYLSDSEKYTKYEFNNEMYLKLNDIFHNNDKYFIEIDNLNNNIKIYS